MKVVIDTSALVALARYYLPFDKKGVLFNFFRKKIEAGEIIIIDQVLQECAYTSKGLVLSTMNYLNEKSFKKANKVPFKTDDIIAPSPAKFLRQVENQFVNGVVRKQQNITETEFDILKESFLKGADMRQVLLCLNIQKDGERIVLVTEETEVSNDNKLFKKLPAICKELQIETMTLPELLAMYEGIDLDFQ